MRDLSETCLKIAEIKARAVDAQSPQVMKETVDRIHDANPITARNAAWVITHFHDEQVACLRNRQSEFMALAMHTSNSSLRRLLLNVIERQAIQPQGMDIVFLDFCFSHMMSPAETPGIQSLCMKLAFQQCRHYPELLHEFNETLSLMQDGYAVSVRTLRKKLLKQSERLIQQHTHGEQTPSLP